MHPLVGRLSLLPDRRAQDMPLAPWRAAGIAVVWTVATSLVPLVLLVLVGWLTGGLLGQLVDPVRLAVDIWLAGHGVPLELGAGSLTLHPLGLTLLVVALLWRGGRWAGRSAAPATFAAAGRLTAMLAGGYGAATALLAVAGNGPAARPDVLVAGVAGLLLAASVGGLGVLSGASLLTTARSRVPQVWRVAVDSGIGAALVLVGLSALLLGGVLAVRHDTAYDLAVVVGPDTAGWPLLLVLNLMLVPNAVLAALAYATGPGFAVGLGTSVTFGGSQVAALPPLSLLAAVPGSPEPHVATYLVLAIPLLAGIAAGLLAVRRSGTLRPEMCALAGLGAGPVAGALAMLAAWAASGGVGTGQLATIGPTGWLVGAVVAAQVGVVAAATAWVGCPRGRSEVAPAIEAQTTSESQSPATAARPLVVASVLTPATPATPAADADAANQIEPEVASSVVASNGDEPMVSLVCPSEGADPSESPPVPPSLAPRDGLEDEHVADHGDDGEETVVLERNTG